MVLCGTIASTSKMSSRRKLTAPVATEREDELRRRIRQATFELLTRHGYARTSTLEIASRAKVSKRELYALFRDKHAILASCIEERAKAVQVPLELPAVRDKPGLGRVLESFGATALRTLSHPAVSAMFRLAIADSDRSPEVAQTLNKLGRAATRDVLIKWIAQAQSEGLLGEGDPPDMAERFFALLWGGLRLQLLLRLAPPPTEEEIERRAHAAADAFLRLHSA